MSLRAVDLAALQVQMMLGAGVRKAISGQRPKKMGKKAESRTIPGTSMITLQKDEDWDIKRS